MSFRITSQITRILQLWFFRTNTIKILIYQCIQSEVKVRYICCVYRYLPTDDWLHDPIGFVLKMLIVVQNNNQQSTKLNSLALTQIWLGFIRCNLQIFSRLYKSICKSIDNWHHFSHIRKHIYASTVMSHVNVFMQ